MTRNLDNRVEIGCPIYEPEIRQELLDTFEMSWKDNVKARIFNVEQDNLYLKSGNKEVRSQFAMYDYYLKK